MTTKNCCKLKKDSDRQFKSCAHASDAGVVRDCACDRISFHSRRSDRSSPCLRRRRYVYDMCTRPLDDPGPSTGETTLWISTTNRT